MNKQELIKRISELPYSEGPIADIVTVNRNWILGSIEQLDKPQEVPVPQFVAEWIEKGKKELSLRDLMSSSYTSTEVGNWLGELDEDGGFKNQETFARAVLDGYTVEKEKRYIVKMSATKQPLFYNNMYEKTFFSLGDLATRFTRKQLEGLGLGWVFDCPGIEIEEVTE